MPSHFSSIGFTVGSDDELVALVGDLAQRSRPVPAPPDSYLVWAPGTGEELWLQVDHNGALIGLAPHFSGKSRVRVWLDAPLEDRRRARRLDGTFQAWAAPEDESGDDAAYPFVFQSPDAATYRRPLPRGLMSAQIAAFAHDVCYSASVAEFEASQEDQELRFASRAFIPAGLLASPTEGGLTSRAFALLSGHVLESQQVANTWTRRPFHWAVVESFGGVFDVVIDPLLLDAPPEPGGVLAGTFWLSGRLIPANSR